MLDLTKFNTKKKKTLSTGFHFSRVDDVYWSKGFIEGQAIEIKYTITDTDGTEHEFKETFYNDDSNERTNEFFEYLKQHGIDDINEFVGCTEEVDIRKNATNRGVFKTIYRRKFISKSTSSATVTSDEV